MTGKALVTGCAGFIGSHLCDELLRRKWEVVGMDCFIDNYSKKLKVRNISQLVSSSRFRFIDEDITKAPLSQYIKDIDVIFHLASLPGVRESWGESFNDYVVNNILATQRLLEAVKDRDIQKFVYASSSSVYGNTGMLPMKEIHLPRPFSPYGVTKLAAENLCHLYYKNYAVPVVSLRYFTVYGPRQRPDMSVSRFINAIHASAPITVYGDGTQKRDFTYVHDVVRANILAVQLPTAGEVFNVGTGNPVGLLEVIRILEKIMGKRALLRFTESQKGDVKDTFADISKARELLGFQPSIGLEEGLLYQVEAMNR